MEVQNFLWVLLGFSSGTESVGDWFQVFIATLTCPPHITAPEKKRKGLQCCLLALLRKSWMKCWIDEFIKRVLSFLQNRGARLASSFCRTQSNESVRHVKVLFLWDGWIASDTLCIFMSWQLHNISSNIGSKLLLTKVWIIVFLSLWFFKLAWVRLSVPLFSLRCRSQVLDWLLLSKTVHCWFSLPHVGFLHRLCRPGHFSLAVWHREVVHVVEPHLKSTSVMELPKRSFSCRSWISSSLKAAEALGLLPLPFCFRLLYFDLWLKHFPSLLRLDVFHKAKFVVFFFKWWSKLAKNALKELGWYSLLSFLWTVITNLRRNLLSSCLISPFKTRNLWNRATFSWYSHFPVRLSALGSRLGLAIRVSLMCWRNSVPSNWSKMVRVILLVNGHSRMLS